jgi:S-DNA-T family DNA segregation ATPase FtsK/SpoIIIE
MTAFIVFFVFAWIAFMLMSGISPKQMFGWMAKPFKRNKDDVDLSDIKKKEDEHKFQMHAGVPVEHHEKGEESKPTPRMSSFKNSAVKLTAVEDHAALTAASDPDWKFPGLNLLSSKQDKADPGDVEGNAEIIRESLANFGIEVEMEGANVGPRVTQYTLKPGTGVKMSKIVGLGDNMAYDLAATSIRIEAPIPGKRAVGVEVPNVKSATVTMQSLMNSEEWKKESSPLAFSVGKDIAGNPIIGDLADMPHMLVAGQTKSGKSVMINSFLTSLLYRNSPADLKLILVDPKLVEMAPYNDIPHLLTPIVNEPEKCISALKWAVAEMERRYRSLADEKVRNIAEYNNKRQEEGMPYIVIVIDELADLMMMAARDVEALIVRIAQKARAVGIHLVLATQRPSVDVITGLIKANVPARLAFTVNSQVDSRTIIDMVGAEKLLGYGDMLFSTPEMSKPKRIQGAFISTEETQKLTDFLREQRLPRYDDEIVSMPVQLNGKGGIVVEHSNTDEDDDMWHEAVRVVIESGKASTSLLQRRLRIGYGRASRIIDEMEERGVIGPADGSRPREVLVRSMDEVFGDHTVAPDATQIPVSDDPRDEYLTN